MLRGAAARAFRFPVPPKRPTDAPLGSEERLRVLCRRFARRESLSHPGDSREVARPHKCYARPGSGSVYAKYPRKGTNHRPRWVAEVARGKSGTPGYVVCRRGPFPCRRDAEAALRELLAELGGG